MADGYIGLPNDGTGKKLDAESLVIGAATVYRERDQIAGRGAADIADVTNADPEPNDYGLITREASLNLPRVSNATALTVPAGGSDDLDSDQVNSGNIGKLLGIEVASSVAFKMVVKAVSNAAETDIITKFGWFGHAEFKPVRKELIQVLQQNPGFSGWRVTVTNLVTGNHLADFYAFFSWDETPQ